MLMYRREIIKQKVPTGVKDKSVIQFRNGELGCPRLLGYIT
uniref:Uncharacterized protein n=1 Tax=Anguilla anguilla TaxID=7936 RepID=A0A0E9QQN3_ANGAN